MSLFFNEGNAEEKKNVKYGNRRKSLRILDILIQVCIHIIIDNIRKKIIAKCHFSLTEATPRQKYGS